MMEALAQPFPAEVIQWKPGATNKDKSRGLALAYVDLRHYIDRLNEVAGPDWSDGYEVQAGGTVVLCRLTIAGMTRADVGEASANDENTATTALAQAFKRACVKFGLGAYLYRLPRMWVEYDAQRKGFTDAALARLQKAISGGNANVREKQPDNGDKPDREPIREEPVKEVVEEKADNEVKPDNEPAAPEPVQEAVEAKPAKEPPSNGNGGNSNGNRPMGPTEFWTAVKDLGMDKAAALEIARRTGTWTEKIAALN
jgi:hypothetical protein